MVRFWLAAAALAALSGQAAADGRGEAISAYNAALGSGDAQRLETAALDLADMAMASPGAADSALLAFEAAWTLCRLGRCDAGRDAAVFASAQPAADGAQPSAADRRLLVAYIDWRGDPKRKTRRALDDALAPLAAASPSALSLTAFAERMEADMARRRWRDGVTSAEAAAAHVAPVADQVPQIHYRARMGRIVAMFNADPEKEQLIEMAHLHGGLLAEIDALDLPENESAPQWLTDLRFETDAWRIAMTAYLASGRWGERDLETEVAAVLDGYDTDRGEGGEPDIGETPFCEGQPAPAPEPDYPTADLRAGYVGAVLIGFDVVQGEIDNLEVLAAVPDRGFAQAAMESLQGARWEPAAGQDLSACRMSRTNLVFPFQFVIR